MLTALALRRLIRTVHPSVLWSFAASHGVTLGPQREAVMDAGCNAISIQIPNNICWPKKITSGLKQPMNHEEGVDHMSLCPIHPGCGKWLEGYDQTGRYDMRGKEGLVVDQQQCVDKCKSIIGCNAVAFVDKSDGSGKPKSMCYPKSVPSGPNKARPPNPQGIVDYMQLCPDQHVCGTWRDGYDRGGQGDIPGTAKVREFLAHVPIPRVTSLPFHRAHLGIDAF